MHVRPRRTDRQTNEHHGNSATRTHRALIKVDLFDYDLRPREPFSYMSSILVVASGTEARGFMPGRYTRFNCFWVYMTWVRSISPKTNKWSKSLWMVLPGLRKRTPVDHKSDAQSPRNVHGAPDRPCWWDPHDGGVSKRLFLGFRAWMVANEQLGVPSLYILALLSSFLVSPPLSFSHHPLSLPPLELDP